MKFVKVGVVVLLLGGGFLWFGVKDAFSVVQRTSISSPVYTIGDSSYKASLSEGKRVVKFGPMFWGIYSGGLAFESLEQAEQYAASNSEFMKSLGDDWAVYMLSGNFDEDTTRVDGQHYLNKSLLVLGEVN